MLMIVMIARPRPTTMMPTDSDRDEGAALTTRRTCKHTFGVLQRNLPAFDHRHPLAVMHLELLRALPESKKNDEHPGKHAEDEDGANNSSAISAPILPTGRLD